MVEVLRIVGGIFKTNTGQYIIKNIKLYKSLQWTSGVVKIHNSVYKHIEPADLPDEKPYYIEISRFNNQQSLQCDDMIIYQQAKLFEFTLELTLAEGFKSTDILYTDILYEYVVKEL
jgi:hypothetical protein